MNRVFWRWEEKDFGFRFRVGKGKRTEEYYQTTVNREFYIVPKGKRKLSAARVKDLSESANMPNALHIVPNPWQNYEREWDWIVTENGICLNYAGCLDKEEIDRREDEGVARVMEYITSLLDRPESAPLTIELLCQIHRELMGTIYPFAGNWRTVDLHKGEGVTKWPLPPCGIGPIMDILDRDVFSRSPLISDDDEEIFAYTSEVMNEVIAIHPFREGNGRTAFLIGNLILMQNNMLPIDVYDRHRDEERYFAACEAGRVRKDYAPLASLISQWESEAFERWEAEHGQI